MWDIIENNVRSERANISNKSKLLLFTITRRMVRTGKLKRIGKWILHELYDMQKLWQLKVTAYFAVSKK